MYSPINIKIDMKLLVIKVVMNHTRPKGNKSFVYRSSFGKNFFKSCMARIPVNPSALELIAVNRSGYLPELIAIPG